MDAQPRPGWTHNLGDRDVRNECTAVARARAVDHDRDSGGTPRPPLCPRRAGIPLAAASKIPAGSESAGGYGRRVLRGRRWCLRSLATRDDRRTRWSRGRLMGAGRRSRDGRPTTGTRADEWGCRRGRRRRGTRAIPREISPSGRRPTRRRTRSTDSEDGDRNDDTHTHSD